MSSLQIVRTLMMASSDVTDVIGQKFYPIEAPQGEAPDYIVANIVGGKDEQMLSGAAGYYESLVRLEFLSTQPQVVLDLGDVALEVLGSVVKQTVGNFGDVDVAFANTDVTDSDNERTMSRRILQFSVRYRRRA